MLRMTSVYTFFKKHTALQYGCIFVLSFSVFLILQWTRFFPDPDSFYHLKMAQLIMRDGIVTSFPWAHFTTLVDTYANQHFLYHVFLIPFIAWFDPFAGLKVATAVFSASFATIFFFFLRSSGVRYPFFWTVLLLLSSPLTFRLSLAKAVSFSLAILFLGLYYAVHKRYRLLCVVSFLYVWAYGGFPLLGVLIFIYAFFHVFFERDIRGALKLLFSVGLGFTLGLIVNPFFPGNVFFYWQQTVQIGAINYQDKIGVGGEWYPYGIGDLLSGSVLVTLFVCIGIIWFFMTVRKQKALSVSAFLWFVFFLMLTLKSRRYVEYYMPFAIVFAAVSLRPLFDSLKKEIIHVLKHKRLSFFERASYAFMKFSPAHKIFSVTFFLYLVLIIPAVVVKDFQTNFRDTHNGIRYDTFADSATWLANHSNKGDIVFHSDWDEFPELFYYDDVNYFIVGLDPTFMFRYNEDLYWKWARVTTGEQKDDLYDIIHGSFRARYVFVTHDHTAMKRNLAADDHFSLVYQDDEASVYAVNVDYE